MISNFSHVSVLTKVDLAQTGLNLRIAREKKKFSAKDMAYKMGLSAQSVYNWEKGKNNLDLNNIVSICDLLGTSIEKIIVTKKEEKVINDYDE